MAKKEKPLQIDRSEKQGKKMPVLPFAILTVCMVAAAAITAVVLSGGGSVEQKLEKAADYTAQEEYEDADRIYDQLLSDDITLVDAYLGRAQNDLARHRTEAAVVTLEQGLTATADQRIEDMLMEVRPPAPDEEGLEEEAPASAMDVPIVWQDSALEAMVRKAMGLSAGTPITPGDLQSIHTLKIVGGSHAVVNGSLATRNTMDGYTVDEVLYTERGDIRSLDDLAHFTGLRKLTIGYNQISDISGIADLTGLETVALYVNQISDISALSGLTELRYLYLYGNSITSLAPLDGMTSLRELLLQHNQITDISPLSGLHSLTGLYVGGNQIADISPISSLGSLNFFYADNNQIADISAVAGASALTDASFLGNPVSDFSAAGNVNNLNRQY